MLYSTLKIKEKEYKLRLNSRATVLLEKRINKNPLQVFVMLARGVIPTMEETICILHASMQPYHCEITEDKTYDLYDEYVESGGTQMDLYDVLTDVIEKAGFIKKPTEGEEEESQEKNV